MVQILVVEDDANIRNVICSYLKKEGFVVHEADDGLEALEEMDSHPIDLIFLDIMLPEKDGWEVCQEIRRDRDIREVSQV
ncbi:response regulator [Polycladomyces subterraneus]|uniref:Response regulator n=1 Tax=Polycladomyces subterraneus TaxID=1016997 RepID=A0ABT8IM21_9BACL|nr:response regulator [Polycladomyces subterraneus]MDN4593447.1 response regulator [Polycladomyces subterraneus]